MSNQVMISSFHKIIGPRGPVPNSIGFSFEDMIRELAPEEIAKAVPIGKYQLNNFIACEPRYIVRHLSTTQQDLADRNSAWVYEICTSQGFLNHAELSQDQFWGALWDSVPLSAKNAVTAGAMQFLVTSLPEDSTPASVIKILLGLKATNAPMGNISVCSSSLFSEKAKREIVRQTGADVRSVPWFECNVLFDDRNGNRIARKSPFHESHHPTKRFTLLNRRINSTPHRVALFLAVLERRLDTFGHISMPWDDLSTPGFTFRNQIDDLNGFPESPNRDRLIAFGKEYFKDGAQQLPLKLDVDFSSNFVRRFATNDHFSQTLHRYFDDSYFSVIPECHHMFGGDDELHAPAMISEKTFFAMRNFHPFVIMGEPHTLKRLRDYGYLTFSKWIDESYDLITDTIDRAIAVTEVVEGLCKLSESEIRKMVLDMESTLKHNHSQVKARVDLSIENTFKLIAKQLRVR